MEKGEWAIRTQVANPAMEECDQTITATVPFVGIGPLLK
jgi:hypothetical protein